MDDTAHLNLKLVVAWLGTAFGTLSAWPLSQWVLLATLGFTLINGAKTLRDWRRSNRADRVAEQALASATATVQAINDQPQQGEAP